MVVKSRDWITAEEQGSTGVVVETGYRLENRHMEFQEGGNRIHDGGSQANRL
jgi:hypothetical protein